jgi:hypothetical protein
VAIFVLKDNVASNEIAPAAASAFFGLAACGIVPITQQIQAESFPVARARPAVRAWLRSGGHCLSFSVVYFYRTMAENVGQVEFFFAGVLALGAVYGWFVFRPASNEDVLESSRLLEPEVQVNETV